MPDDTPDDALARLVGRRVRAARGGLGLTLDALAARSGVSRRMIVNVESGGSNASIATLLRLARALEVTLSDLVAEGPPEHDVTVSTPDGRTPLWRGDGGGAAVLVASGDSPDMLELWDWSLGPGDVYGSEAHRPGTRELMHVLSGRLRLTVAGAVHELAAGDGAGFPGDVPHEYANPWSDLARFSLTVLEPRPRLQP